jgi:hypothetical protein
MIKVKEVAYASKGFSKAQNKKTHLIEGECYALIWGIMFCIKIISLYA